MKKLFWLILGFLLLLSACQSQTKTITILDGDQVISLATTKTIPKEIFAESGITIGPDDRLLYLGSSIPLDTDLLDGITHPLTIRRAVAMTVVTADGEHTIQTSAMTVGQALAEAGYALHTSDRFDPPSETLISAPLTVTYHVGKELVVTVDGYEIQVRSSAYTVGQAMAEAGIPLIGLDYTLPPEPAPLPEDGQIRVVRVVESIALTQKTIPFETRTELSADLEIDQQLLLQGGEPGLVIARIRTRSEDGVQISQQTENEVVVRPPQDRIQGIGTKIVIRTTTVDGVTFEYWRALNLKATSYSPCQSDTPDGSCSYLTFNEKPVQKGVVAMVRSWFYLFESQRLYIPGYGEAMVADVGGGWPPGNHYWVDLAWTDAEYKPLMYANGVTVYFLTPVPANPGYILP